MSVFDKTGKMSFGSSNKGLKKSKKSKKINFFSGNPKKTKKANSGDESRSEVRKMQKNKEYVRSHTSGKKKVYSGLKKSPTNNLLFGGSEVFKKKRG
jgi:hypothetical protein